MNTSDTDPLDGFRLLAAKHSLGLLNSWEILPVADQLLVNGVYSYAVAELATTTSPSMSVVAPMLEQAVAELNLGFPSKIDAAWLLARHCICRIASDGELPFEPLSLLKDVSRAARDVLPDKTYAGDGLDLGSLIGIQDSYTEPGENYYPAEKRFIHNESERRAILDQRAREESRLWLTRHSTIAIPDTKS